MSKTASICTATMIAILLGARVTSGRTTEMPFGAGQHRTYHGTLAIARDQPPPGGAAKLTYDVALYVLVYREHENGEPASVLLHAALAPHAEARGGGEETSPPAPSQLAEQRFLFLELGADWRVTESFGHWHLPAFAQLIFSPVPPKTEDRTVSSVASPLGALPVTQVWTRSPRASDASPMLVEGRGPRREDALEVTASTSSSARILDLVERYSVVESPLGAHVQSYSLGYSCERSSVVKESAGVELSLELASHGAINEDVRFQHRAELGTLLHFLKQVGPSANLDELAEISVMLRERLLGSPYRELGLDTLEEMIEETRAARAELIAEQVRLEELLGTPFPAFEAEDLAGQELPQTRSAGQVTLLIFLDEKSASSAALLAALKEPLVLASERACAIALSAAATDAAARAALATLKSSEVGISAGHAALFATHRLRQLPVVVILDYQRIVRAVHVGFDPEAGPREIADKLQGALDVTRARK